MIDSPGVVFEGSGNDPSTARAANLGQLVGRTRAARVNMGYRGLMWLILRHNAGIVRDRLGCLVCRWGTAEKWQKSVQVSSPEPPQGSLPGDVLLLCDSLEACFEVGLLKIAGEL